MHAGQVPHIRFNGASLFRARKPVVKRIASVAYHRFNGASLFRARKPGTRRVCRITCSAGFNGASLFRARKLGWLYHRGEYDARFNGASLFRARKRRIELQANREHDASMGPHSFERGNPIGFDPKSLALTGLQWGLTLSSEETFHAPHAPQPMYRLQWGLTLSSEETSVLIRLPQSDMDASMGPHSFERGNLVLLGKADSSRRLQWGLTLSSEETSETTHS